MPAITATSGHWLYITFVLSGEFVPEILILIILLSSYEKLCIEPFF